VPFSNHVKQVVILRKRLISYATLLSQIVYTVGAPFHICIYGSKGKLDIHCKLVFACKRGDGLANTILLNFLFANVCMSFCTTKADELLAFITRNYEWFLTGFGFHSRAVPNSNILKTHFKALMLTDTHIGRILHGLSFPRSAHWAFRMSNVKYMYECLQKCLFSPLCSVCWFSYFSIITKIFLLRSLWPWRLCSS